MEENMDKNYLGSNIPKLGFGLMRLPMNGEVVDLEQTKKMVDAFMAKGFTYFDTAYVYIGGTSEVMAKKAIVERYPRDSFQLATKLAMWEVKEEADMAKQLETSLTRAGVDYFDFYLIHSIQESNIEAVNKFDAWSFVLKAKEEGKAKHVGFSFHDTPEKLDALLTAHPEMEFVQLQINYADWESEDVQSRACYEVCMKHGKPVIIMEPVKGGSLAMMHPSIAKPMTDYAPDKSIASWAIRYCASLPGLITVLSGMSNEEQMNDNLNTMADFKALTEEEYAILDKVVEGIKEAAAIPCTACKYCVEDCPMQINIPEIFAVYNQYTAYNNMHAAQFGYKGATEGRGKASQCLQCGACEGHCPQHINIIENLAKIASVLEK